MPTDKPSWWRRLLALPRKLFRRRTATTDIQADDRALVMSLSTKRIPSFNQLRHLPRLLTATEQRLVRLGLVLMIASALVLIGHSVFRHVSFVPTNGGSFTEGLVGAPQFLNPVLARSPNADRDLTGLLFRGLMRLDDHLQVVPDLAASLTVSADGKTYTAKLKSDLVWSNGDPITSDDIRYTYETVADAAYQSPYLNTFANVAVATPDASTVIFTLTEPNEPFRAALTLGILPAKLWLDQSPQTFPLAELNIKPVGSGPYKFQSITKDRNGNIKEYTFIRNRTFSGQPVRIEKITFKIYPDFYSAIDALTSNAIDNFGGITASELAKVQKSRQVSHFGLSQITAVFFSQKSNPALKTKEVRQALAMAVDRPAIIASAFKGIGRPADGPLLPGQPGYSADIKRFGLDLAQANTVLDQAGWKRGDDGLRSKNKQGLTFDITTVDEPTYVAAANMLAEAWKGLGATVGVKTVAADRIQKDVVRPRAYDALVFGQITNADADPYSFWHSSQQRDPGLALAVGFLKKVDQDLETAQKATTMDAHNAALRDFQTVIADEVPAIILDQSVYLYAHVSSLRGFPSDQIVSAANRFDGIASWYVKTKLSWK